MSFIGVWLMSGKLTVALAILATTSFEAIREYVFAVLPLFILMGAFMSNSGAAKDLFSASNYLLKRLPGGMGVATVAANAVFAAVTGVSVASAAVFSKISLPEMVRLNYDKKFAVGAVAGSSVLGMLIPPSVLLIIFGMLSEASIGKLFVAGVMPGVVLALIYSIGIVTMSVVKPEIAGRKKAAGDTAAAAEQAKTAAEGEKFGITAVKSLPVFILVILVLGGIWGGLFTPTEASAVGALGAMVVAFFKKISFQQLKEVLLETAATSSTILFLLITAQMYSRMLSMSGLVVWLGDQVAASNVSSGVVMFLLCILLLILGCILDSTSILLLTVPLILPIAAHFQWDLLWLGIVMVMVTEMGLLTPPFGMVAFAMKATLGDAVALEDIFRGSLPFLLMMAIGVLVVIAFPVLSTWLPSLM
jgi:tripartite ATP-independent transporter DctM subunit